MDVDQCDGQYHGTIIHILHIGNDSASIEFRHLLVSISSYYSRYITISCANSDLRERIPNEKSLHNFSFIQCFRFRFYLCDLNGTGLLIICISQPLLPFMRFWCSSDQFFLVLQCHWPAVYLKYERRNA